MRIVVTGGAGFIGSHIVDAYLKAGHGVAVIDNLSTGSRKNLNPKAKFYKADIRRLSVIEKIFKKERPHAVNHHAAIAEVVKSVRNPIPTLEVNVLGTANVFLSLGMHGRGKNRKFIFSSTGGALYGIKPLIPTNEETPIVPPSPYGLSKLLGEEAIRFYSSQFGIPYTIFRYANVYGPRQIAKGEAGIVPIFVGLMKKGKRPTIFGDGTKTRDYVFISDVVRANTLALQRGANETINIGVGKETTDQEMFDALAKAAHFDQKARFSEFRKGEVYRIALDIRKAKKILGWKPKTNLKKGIEKTVKTLL